jgi:heme/copper-type cytochrome/quinol oxidase subunit 3
MGHVVTTPRTLDVSGLPTVVFGHRSTLWWATMGLALIEGTMFAILMAGYFYLRTRATDWPPGILPPDPLWGTITLVIVLASIFPNHWVKKIAKEGDLRKVRIGLLALIAIGLVLLVVRGFEFTALGGSWMANAYASSIWFLLGFHTAHLLTDWADTIVLTALMFTKHVEGKRYMDVYENSDYWYFVVFTWVPVYFVIYWAPRVL